MKIIRIEEVIDRVQLSRSTIWRMESAGHFPERIRHGRKAMGWSLDEIEEWISTRPRGLQLP